MPLRFDLGNQTMDDLLSSSEQEPQNIQKGGVYFAKIVRIEDSQVLVSLGGKLEGLIPRKECLSYNVGDSFEVVITGFNKETGIPDVSKYLLEQRKNWTFIREVYHSQLPIEGTIIKKITQGYLVRIYSLYFVLPTNELGIISQDLDDAMSKKRRRVFPMQAFFKIKSLNVKKKTGVVSHKDIVAEKNEERWKSFISQYKESDIITVVVKHHSNLGIFVEVEDIMSFIHVDNITWGRKKVDIKNMFSINTEIQARILEINLDTKQVQLGYKQLKDNPWEEITNQYKVGDIINGMIYYTGLRYALIQINEDIDAVLNSSDISWVHHVSHTKDVLNVNENIDVKIIGMNPRSKKILLGIKQMQEDPWLGIHNHLKENEVYNGKVISTKNFGIFIFIEGLIEGFIPIEEISWTSLPQNWESKFSLDSNVKCKIVSMDVDNKKIKCSIKQTLESPLEPILVKYRPNTLIMVKISKVVSKGIEVLVDDSITAFIPIQAIPISKNKKKLQEIYKKDESIQVVFHGLDPHLNKLRLSLKGINSTTGKKEMNSYVEKENSSQQAMDTPFATLKEKIKA